MSAAGHIADESSSVAEADAPEVGPSSDDWATSGLTVLVVEDDEDICMLIRLALERAGYRVVCALDANAAMRCLHDVRPALVTLDLMLPGMDGHEALRQIRQVSNVPVVVVSALTGTPDVVRALDAGGADYVTKPFHPAELVSRVAAVLRRAEPPPSNTTVFPQAGIHFDVARRRLARHGQEIRLSPKEFEVLWLLVKRAGSPVSYETICREIWGEDSVRVRDRAKWVVFLLRRKIEDDPGAPRYLLSRPGYGYEFRSA